MKRKGNIKNTIKEFLTGRSLANKIRYTYIVVAIPFVVLILYCIRNLWESNRRYDDMMSSTLMATEFGLDFKESFDYETYLLIAGDTPIHESKLKSRLNTARAVVKNISEVTDSEENLQRLVYVSKFLNSLETYTTRIEEKLIEGDQYEECIEIWENDVQIVTTLISETMSEFIYYEVRYIQDSKAEYERIYKTMIRSSVIGFAVALVLILGLSYIIPQSLTRPITEITMVTDEVANGNLSVRAQEYVGSEAKLLAESINVMIDRINELLVQVKQEQLSLRKAEFDLLQSQINPHFLYNTLDAIVWLAESGEREKVVEMVENLSAFFRMSLNHGKEIVSVKDEMEHVRSYLSIQQVRYQDILKYEIEVDSQILEEEIPKLSVQPFVENALYHGIKEKRGGGRIRVVGKADEKAVIIEITDDGAGMTENRLMQVRSELDMPERENRSIYGMYNVNQRIKLNYGKEYGVEISSEIMKGTTARIVLPRKISANKDDVS